MYLHIIVNCITKKKILQFYQVSILHFNIGTLFRIILSKDYPLKHIKIKLINKIKNS